MVLKKFSVGGGGGWKVIIVSALSLSLRDKERLRDRESLTIYFTAKFKIEVFYTSIGSRKKTGKAKGWVKKNHMDFSIFGSENGQNPYIFFNKKKFIPLKSKLDLF